jgi:pyroglutamyl-peptidase
MPLKVLITGFGPFPGAPFNPTERLVRRLARRRSAHVQAERIPHVFCVSYAAVEAELPQLIARHRPDVVLLFGLASRSTELRIETQALNARSVLLPDAAGVSPADRTIDPQGPSFRRGHAPYRRLVAAVRASGAPARLSRDAGQYLCNFAFWHALRAAAADGTAPIVQFVHVPLVRAMPIPVSRRRRRWLTPADLERAAEAILAALIAAARAAAIQMPQGHAAKPILIQRLAAPA